MEAVRGMVIVSRAHVSAKLDTQDNTVKLLSACATVEVMVLVWRVCANASLAGQEMIA